MGRRRLGIVATPVPEKKAVGKKEFLEASLRDDLAWYNAQSSHLKESEKVKLAQAYVERIKRILEAQPRR